MPYFDLVVLGCGGGPNENNLSSYLVKSSLRKWSDGILSAEAGSGLGALKRLLRRNPLLFHDSSQDFHQQDETDEDAVHALLSGEDSALQRSTQLYSCINTFLVTHAHLDHIAGLIIGAGATTSSTGSARFIAGMPNILEDIRSCVFDAQKLWPRLAFPSGEAVPPSAYVYNPITPGPSYTPVSPDISVSLYPISHGTCQTCPSGVYDSTAFFIRHDPTLHEFLLMGDVEPDSLSHFPRTRQNVWRVAAPKIIDSALDHIFLECSWTSDRAPSQLYGHLSPPYVVQEMQALAEEVQAVCISRGLPLVDINDALSGVSIVIIHCKEPTDESVISRIPHGSSVRQLIVDEINTLLAGRFGLKVFSAYQGMRLRMYPYERFLKELELTRLIPW